ncbi:putative branched-chain amino acid ABC transporter, ATP-binding protein [Bradyrhizobium sp. STM 3843]|uniref:ABC transporter ATP-binding protein n=1 Tax=Bradyrhizobium sp. STM 3843 TaxID=551947 RepID=UPI0002406C47|nr:ABC transporter ATP-binding protein [Bradyrhizobium sp. STM 3843]CCE06233.1 putative branched-chain amino acid ABC transporter, ATP-binding protein [Bradyrhizobium sp. STM 3843]
MTTILLDRPQRAAAPIASAVRGRAAASMLTARDLTVRFGDFEALRGVSINLDARSIHAVIGPNGAGKTTLFNVISGFVKPSGGQVRLNDVDVTAAPPNRLARLGLARSFQICSIFPNLSVADNIRTALALNLRGLQLLRGRSRRDENEARVRHLLDQGGLANESERRAADLPYGRRRLLEIVTTIAIAPKFLLLDEPTAGLAREDIAPVAALIKTVAASCGVLLVEHNLQVVRSLATKVTVLAEGSVLCEGGYDEVARDARVINAYIGAERRA